MIPFVKMWGGIGAAWAMFCSGTLSLILHFVISQHYYRIEWEYGKLSVMLGILFGASFILLLMRYLDVSYWKILSMKLMAMAALVYVGIKINIITRENVMVVMNLVRGVKSSMGQVFLKPTDKNETIE